MTEQKIRFDDGAAYERMMGTWSRLVGEAFLDWLAPSSGLRWIDVGCGNGAFTELLVDRCAPAGVVGLDSAEGQLAFARTRPASRVAEFRHGDAMALPFAAGQFDAAVMALVIFFVPDPAKGAAEMARVVRPGGTVAAYAWDMAGGGSPIEVFQTELRALGHKVLRAPNADASRLEAMRKLWSDAGLEAVETHAIEVRRTFANFEECWTFTNEGSAVGQTTSNMAPGDIEALKARMRARLPADAAGRITYDARANAVRGRVPK